MYHDQISRSEDYIGMAPAVAIGLIGEVSFSDTPQQHHRFAMVDRESNREIDNAIAVHTVEPTKLDLDERTISRKDELDRWVFLL
ncbi:MAG: hypothetical protein AAFP90_17875, partial [Planctomycetota bacterium]